MRILHTEASPGWGGQEMRILKESMGMRKRGHKVVMAVQRGGGLVIPAREAGFTVYEIPFSKKRPLCVLISLFRILRRHKIDLINTHSSVDGWLAGFAARLFRRKVIRTRHLSTPVKGGLNGYLLYNALADQVVTTCQAVVEPICRASRLPKARCRSIPTGVNPQMPASAPFVSPFSQEDLVVGTLCVMRGWKGIADLLNAAHLLREEKQIKWLIVGSGVSEEVFKKQHRDLALEKIVHFTGHIAPPFAALEAMDIFALLSWANEGVSQASLQAGLLGKPFVTTRAGGLPEVCIEGKTGHLVEAHSPEQVAQAVLSLRDAKKRKEMGESARKLVLEQFTASVMLEQMEEVYQNLPGFGKQIQRP